MRVYMVTAAHRHILTCQDVPEAWGNHCHMRLVTDVGLATLSLRQEGPPMAPFIYKQQQYLCTTTHIVPYKVYKREGLAIMKL